MLANKVITDAIDEVLMKDLAETLVTDVLAVALAMIANEETVAKMMDECIEDALKAAAPPKRPSLIGKVGSWLSETFLKPEEGK